MDAYQEMNAAMRGDGPDFRSCAAFIRFETGLGGEQVAVFSEHFREFVLNSTDLEARIRNLAEYGHPCLAENAALAEMNHRAGEVK